MRLTLRTLLAYLDDTLEAGEIRQIGQKVNESEAAQELVTRIKQVTRRRRLTAPPDGGPDQRFDANLVASYLDNDLSAEVVAELEKLCLESDVHLAEMAACHQILTLVLGEPALVPPTARRRMYALIQGRPSKVTARPTPAVRTTEEPLAPHAAHADPDDTLMALPLFRNLPWLRWALPLAAVVLLVVLGVFLFGQMNREDRRSVRGNRDSGDPPAPEKDRVNPPDRDKAIDKDKVTDSAKTLDKDKTADKDKTLDKDKTADKDKPADKPPPNGGVQPIPRAAEPPSTERKPAGRFVSRGEVLVRQDRDGFRRIEVDGTVHTAEQLVSLPGYKSQVRLEKQVDLLLWGNLPETQLEPLTLLESAVTLYQPGGNRDVDLTLHRGRIFLTNRKEKEPARIRVRFWRDEVWDLTLEEPETMVGLEVMSAYVPELKAREAEEPLVQAALYVARGSISLKVDRRTFGNLQAPPGRAVVQWNNKGPGILPPFVLDAKHPLWDLEQPPPKEPQLAVARQLKAALEELAGALSDPGKRVVVALMELLEGSHREKRFLAIRCLGTLDAIPQLLDVLAKEDAARFDVRQEALFALRTWLSRGKEQGPKLYDSQAKAGLLIDKGYLDREAQIILDLLYGPSVEEREQRELYESLVSYLLNNRLIIRELAIRHLFFLTRGQFNKIEYNPAAPLEQREEGYRKWKKLLEDKKLPVPLPPPEAPKPN